MAYKYDLTGKRIGKLVVERLLTIEERPTQTHGNYWLCKCDCGNECKVPTTYLTGKSNYTQYSCGCERKKRAFLASTTIQVEEEFVNKYYEQDFEKFLLLHKAIVQTHEKNVKYYNSNINEYKKIIEYFWEDKQFNSIYDFWKKQSISYPTFYDWAKPSLDHIIPKSRGGQDCLENYQFLTVFENLAKRDMTMEEWTKFKLETNTQSNYFIENILKGREG